MRCGMAAGAEGNAEDDSVTPDNADEDMDASVTVRRRLSKQIIKPRPLVALVEL
jgi:hypothetical protein